MFVRRILPALCILAFLSSASRAQSLQPGGSLSAANAVVARELPRFAAQMHLAVHPGPYAGHADGFRITGTRGNIHVEAATVPTLLFGVNWYLKYTAQLNVSTNGDHLTLPGNILPAPAAPIVKPALYPFRYALNENTDGYTTPYWSDARWQHEIDLLALSGYNAVLIQRGVDYALYQAFREAGYPDDALRHWITQPAHQNWQLMGNLCCFIEPITLHLMQQRATSARHVMDMLRALGMTPVMPGFLGVVPDDLGKYMPAASVIHQAHDWDGFQRPGWLDPRSPAFRTIAASFYRHQRVLFGDSTIYDMETFQEGGDAGNVPIREGAKAIQDALETAHPGALWFMMAWHENPKKELLEGVDRSKILIADIEQGRVPRENRDKDFMGARWLWGGLYEYGGRTSLGAPLYDYAVRMPENAAKPGSLLRGTALFTEGIDHNPAAFDLYSEMAFRDQPVDMSQWMNEYADRRYGSDPHARAAWQILLKTAYGYRADGVVGGQHDAPIESLYNAQPALDASSAWHAGLHQSRYDLDAFRDALTELLAVAPALRHSSAYQFDLVDVARQVLANEGRFLLPEIKAAYDAKDKPRFDKLTAEWLADIDLQDRLLASNEWFLFGKWLGRIPAWASSPAELANLNYDARSLLTVWGTRKSAEAGGLHEYGNRDWAGLTRDYYGHRWQLYFASLDTALATNQPPKAIDWYALGDAFSRETKRYSATPTGDAYKLATEVEHRALRRNLSK